MKIKTILVLIGIALIVVPTLPPLIQGIILYYQMVFHTMSADEYQKKILPVITDLIIPTEYSIYTIFGKYGPYAVGFILILYWFLTGEFDKRR